MYLRVCCLDYVGFGCWVGRFAVLLIDCDYWWDLLALLVVS